MGREESKVKNSGKKTEMEGDAKIVKIKKKKRLKKARYKKE